MKRLLMFILLIVLIVIATCTSSCGSRNGYGCHGNSKCITRVR